MVDMRILTRAQELLRKEFNQMKTQMSLVMEILNAVLRKKKIIIPSEGNYVALILYLIDGDT